MEIYAVICQIMLGLRSLYQKLGFSSSRYRGSRDMLHWASAAAAA